MYVCVHIHTSTCLIPHVKIRESLQKLVLFFYQWVLSSNLGNQVCGRCLPLSHLTSSMLPILYNNLKNHFNLGLPKKKKNKQNYVSCVLRIVT